MDLARLPAHAPDGGFNVIVESPRGSPVKLKYEPRMGVFTVSRPLILGLRYPFDWGFIPSTLAPDGDPLDALVLWDVASYPGVVIPCRAVALLRIEQDRKDKRGRQRNDRVLAAPLLAPRLGNVETPDDLSDRVRQEIEAFCRMVTTLADKNVAVLGWGGPSEADALIRKTARKRGR